MSERICKRANGDRGAIPTHQWRRDGKHILAKQRTVLFVGRKIPSQGPTPDTKKRSSKELRIFGAGDGRAYFKKSADFARKALVKFCYKQRTVLFVGRKIPSQGPTPVTKKTKLERASHFWSR